MSKKMERTLIKDTINNIGQEVILYGWVNSIRSHGKIAFIDLRDRSGLVQMVDTTGHLELGNEYVVKVIGLVKKRPEKMVNPKITTGIVEVEIKKLEVLSKCKELPIPIDSDGYDIDEEIRLKYRYLDLRRERLSRNLRLRSVFVDRIRQFLFRKDFVEIETPLLTKSTPEGSRDFLVPSRFQPGNFYALPQSPQQYKQLLMVAGFERYFQIAKCLRDEDLRADRGFEHTQIDVEMSFVNREEVMNILEQMIVDVFESMGEELKNKPFPKFSYKDAIKKFGSDKFDMRNKEEKKRNIKAFAWVTDFPFFEKDHEGNWTFTHNPFSNPQEEYIQDLLAGKNIGNILTSQYDLVCNGFEVGGGSIRSYKPEVLQAVFKILGYEKGEIEEKFGHMLEAFKLGVPPHGGCAFGVDRLMMLLRGEKYLREVVAFPMTSGGKTAVMDAPTPVGTTQLEELGLGILNNSHRDDIFEKIKNLLDDNHIKYKIYKHKPVYTSEQAAKVRGTDIHSGAKALILIADQKPIMVVLPADLKVDFKKLKSKFSIKDLRMADSEEVMKVTNVAIGAVPPFGLLFSLQLYINKRLFENKTVVFNAGRHDRSIEMSAIDYRDVSKGIIW